MDLGLDGSAALALVNGASRGLSALQAAALATVAKEGATVVITGRNLDTLKACRGRDPPHSAARVSASICRPHRHPMRLLSVVDTVLERYGRLDVMVVNAGGPPRVRSLEVSESQLAAALNENLLYPIRMVKAAARPTMTGARTTAAFAASRAGAWCSHCRGSRCPTPRAPVCGHG